MGERKIVMAGEVRRTSWVSKSCCLFILAYLVGCPVLLIWEDNAYHRNADALRAALKPGMTVRDACVLSLGAWRAHFVPDPDDGVTREHPLHERQRVATAERMEAEIAAATSLRGWTMYIPHRQTRTDSFGVSWVVVQLDTRGRITSVASGSMAPPQRPAPEPPAPETPRFTAPPAPPTPPRPPSGPKLASPFVAKPSWKQDGTDHGWGHAFAVRGDSAPIVLTAIHLFGEKITGPALVKAVGGLRLEDLATKKALGTTGVPFLLETAQPATLEYGDGDLSADVAAFPAQLGLALEPLALAPEDPRVDEKVWLACQVEKANAPALHEATVLEVGPSKVIVRFSDDFFRPGGTSGAPFVNAKGEVVAINVAFGPSRRWWVGLANPVSCVRKHLDGRR